MPREKVKSYNKHHLVVKDNRLMEAKFHFSLWEMRIFERMVSMVEKGDTEFRLCRIYIKDLTAFFHSRSNNDYELVREATRSLAYKKLNIPYMKDGRKRWAIISVFPTVTTPDAAERDGENAYVELEFHKDLRPYLLDLKERFKSYDIRNIQHLKSLYSIRLFILLKQYENIGKRYFELQELKEILSIPADKYTHYGSFKQRIITRPQQEIAKHCDIRFEFKEEKKGKKVIGINFKISPNEISFGPVKIEQTNTSSSDWETVKLEPETNINNHPERIYLLVKKYVELFTVHQWLAQYPLEQVENGVNYTLSQLKKGVSINNVGGYLQKMVQQPNLQVSGSKQKVAKSHKKIDNSGYQEQLLQEVKYQELAQKYQAKTLEIISELVTQQPDKVLDLQAKALEKARAILPTASEKSQIVQAQFNRMLKEQFPTAFEVLKPIENAMELIHR